MHYYQFDIADYRKDTSHLSTLEHGIYRQLIDWYYLEESPIPKETQVVIRRLRLGSGSDTVGLQNVLSDFFVLKEDGYHCERCDQEISKFRAKALKNRQNGAKGGRPKALLDKGENPLGFSGLANGNPSESQKNPNLLIYKEVNPCPKVRKATPTDDSDFMDWYGKYPRHESRETARKAWNRLTASEKEKASAGLPAYIAKMSGREKQFIALPATWLNGKRWQDEESAPVQQNSLFKGVI